jgi:hypothetical protein
MLDCTDYDPTTGEWIDRVGGIRFIPRTSVLPTIDTDGSVKFNNSALAWDSPSAGYNKYPINHAITSESVFLTTRTNPRFMIAGATNAVIGYDTSGFFYTGTSTAHDVSVSYLKAKIPIEINKINTISGTVINEKFPYQFRCFHNGVELPSESLKYGMLTNEGGPAIGNSWYSNSILIGNIYNVRLYDRVLSAEEIIHNQNIDKERFGIE